MDYRYLIESGQYSRDDLNEAQNAYIDGEDAVIEELDSVLAELEDGLSESTLDKIVYETCKDFADRIANRVDDKICEDIVVMADSNFDSNDDYAQASQPEPQPVQQEVVEPQPQRSHQPRRSEPAQNPVPLTVQPTTRYGRRNR